MELIQIVYLYLEAEMVSFISEQAIRFNADSSQYITDLFVSFIILFTVLSLFWMSSGPEQE